MVGVSFAVNPQHCFLEERIFMTLLDRLLVQTFTRIFQPGEPVLEIGSHQLKAGGDESHDLRPFVPSKEISSDRIFRLVLESIVLADATRLGIQDRAVGTVVMVSTIEHVFRVFDAFGEIARVLATNGAVVVTSHMDCGIHAMQATIGDFPEAFARLLDYFPAKILGIRGFPIIHLSYSQWIQRMPENFDQLAAQFRFELEQSMNTTKGALPMNHKVIQDATSFLVASVSVEGSLSQTSS